MNLQVETSSKNHIDCIIGGGTKGAWRFTGFYIGPITHKCQPGDGERAWRLYSGKRSLHHVHCRNMDK